MIRTSKRLGSMLVLLLMAATNASALEKECGEDEACKAQVMLRACTDTANQYPYARDRLLYQQYGELFTEHAEFQIEGLEAVKGRDAIVQNLRDRGPATKMRHMNTVIDMQASGVDTASGISYVTIWRATTEDAEGSTGQPWIMAEYHDDYVMEEGRCLISNRFVKIVFEVK